MEALKQLYSLEGLTAIVTGASGGLGFHQAVMLARCGAHVFAVSRSGTMKEPWEGDLPERIKFIRLDVTVEDHVREVFREIGETRGIDVLVNNAGVSLRKRAEEVSLEEWEQVHKVNVTGVFTCCKHAFPFLRQSGHKGRIINISSMASHLGFSEVVPYCSSKASVLGITRSLAVEWASKNVLVNSVSPGWFPSGLSRQVVDNERKDKILNRMPLHRFGNPDELSPMVCFLASPAAGYITGQDFSVDGGARAFGF